MIRKGADEPEFKVSDKGAISAYLGSKFPVTLYAEQWEKLLTDKSIAALKQFIEDNESKLKRRSKKDE